MAQYLRPADLPHLNKPPALTMSAIKHLGLYPDARVVPVMRIWRAGDLAIAEQFIRTVASSLVAQDGFNDTTAGGAVGRPPDAELLQVEESVYHSEPWHKANIEECIRIARMRSNFLAEADSLDVRRRILIDRVRDLQVQFDTCVARAAASEGKLADIKQQRLVMDAKIDTWREKIRSTEGLMDILAPLMDIGMLPVRRDGRLIIPRLEDGITSRSAAAAPEPGAEGPSVPTRTEDITRLPSGRDIHDPIVVASSPAQQDQDTVVPSSSPLRPYRPTSPDDVD